MVSEGQEALEKGIQKMKRAEYDEALAHLNRALADEEVQVEANYYLGVACVNLGRPEEAIGHLEKAAESRLMYQYRGHAEMMLGYLHSRLGNHDTAIVYFERIIQEDAECLQAHTALAHALVKLGRYEEAVKVYRLTLQKDPENSVAHHGLGYALCLMGGDLDEALYQCQQAFRLDPHSAACRDSLGWVLYCHGDYEEAEAHLREAMVLDPHNREIVEHLREARAALERRRANTPPRDEDQSLQNNSPFGEF